MQRYGFVIQLKDGAEQRYRELHAAVWPEVLTTIADCNIRNYTIYIWGNTLFASFEYVGSNYAADMERMAANPKTQQWWKETAPLQEPVPHAKPGEWWHPLEEVFHTD